MSLFKLISDKAKLYTHQIYSLKTTQTQFLINKIISFKNIKKTHPQKCPRSKLNRRSIKSDNWRRTDILQSSVTLTIYLRLIEEWWSPQTRLLRANDDNWLYAVALVIQFSRIWQNRQFFIYFFDSLLTKWTRKNRVVLVFDLL